MTLTEQKKILHFRPVSMEMQDMNVWKFHQTCLTGLERESIAQPECTLFVTQNDCLLFVSIINTGFLQTETDVCIFPMISWGRTTRYGLLLLFAHLLWGIHPSGFIFMTPPPNCLTPVMHPQRTLPPLFFFSLRRSSFWSRTAHTSNCQLLSFLLSHWIHNALWHLSLGQNALLSSLRSFMPTGMSARVPNIRLNMWKLYSRISFFFFFLEQYRWATLAFLLPNVSLF